MSLARARFAAWAAVPVVLVSALLSGCASAPERQEVAELGPWSGRLAVQVEDRPSDSFSGFFELRGNPQRGELQLSTPIGGTLGVLQWEPGRAVLRTESRSTEYDSVDALVTQLAGTPIPVAALFDWLRGRQTPVQGWKADLSLLAQGRVSAHRFEPPPQADLRVILER